jgi:hypothetical protein
MGREREEGRRILKDHFLLILTFSQALIESTSGESVFFLKPPTVGLLELRNFELPAVGLSRFRSNYPEGK